jgi:hypothetical protein
MLGAVMRSSPLRPRTTEAKPFGDSRLHVGSRKPGSSVSCADDLYRAVSDGELGRFGAAFEGCVHLPEAALGRGQSLPEQANEQTAEAFTLDKLGASAVERLDLEPMLSVEKSRREQAPQPAQLTRRGDGSHCRLVGNPADARRLDSDTQPRPDFGVADDRPDERVPLWIRIEVA